MNDPLSEVLLLSGMESALISRARLGCPFGVRAGPLEVAVFHLMARGEVTASSPLHPDVALSEGDILVVPRGAEHTLRSGGKAAAQHISRFPRDLTQGLPTVHNHAPPDVDIVCGRFRLGFPARDWILPALPELLVVRSSGEMARYLRDTIAVLESELASGAPGSRLVVNHLLEVLVVQALRAWARDNPGVAQGWLAAAEDPTLREAFQALSDPPELWSVEHMARRAALSRSRFHEVFRERMGVSPGDWLSTWRVAVAQDAIRRGADLQAAADRAGYSTQATFGRAFKRVAGVPPGAWRRGLSASSLGAGR